MEALPLSNLDFFFFLHLKDPNRQRLHRIRQGTRGFVREEFSHHKWVGEVFSKIGGCNQCDLRAPRRRAEQTPEDKRVLFFPPREIEPHRMFRPFREPSEVRCVGANTASPRKRSTLRVSPFSQTSSYLVRVNEATRRCVSVQPQSSTPAWTQRIPIARPCNRSWARS